MHKNITHHAIWSGFTYRVMPRLISFVCVRVKQNKHIQLEYSFCRSTILFGHATQYHNNYDNNNIRDITIRRDNITIGLGFNLKIIKHE